ncbi:alpha/beta fold hydrolase [Bizionia argentinensis JUB59]|uniref:Alpha/beta fold hydrolase n=1 Tax=Bizionia argentinensis JUB59 TaxID=1046627 RepID=G2EG30_9FLAO|nr:alpha/beta hydrolase [Bizionia argentinensis]EGV42631.1 alpha/beta fold hydrolase [Bizionia argentinensis JUB59]
MKKQYLLLILICFGQSVLAQTFITAEDIMLKNDSIILPGTLTYNKTLKQQPLVIFIHGSGNVDRNGNQLGLTSANYIKQLADSLNQSDIAFYRYDKRSANWLNLRFMMKDLNFVRFVDDAKIAINHFKNDERFSSITLIGHSQGSLVAMLAISEAVDKYVSLAGPAESVDVAMVKQLKMQNDTLGIKAEAHFKELRESGTIEKVDPELAAYFPKQNQLFFNSWMTFTPSKEIKKLNIPILILNGDKDLQVFESDAETLHEANPNSKLVIIPKMNHVLKRIDVDEDNEKSYKTADFPLSEVLIKTLETFINQ